MIKILRKTVGLLLATLMIMILVAPAVFAVECDKDGDKYITLTQDMLEVVVADNVYKADGNYTPEQWKEIFSIYKKGIELDSGLHERYICDNLTFKQGAEPTRCDAKIIDPKSGVYDTSRITSLSGNKVNPDTFDVPNNGIDENCDGADGKYIAGASGEQKDLGYLAQRVIIILGNAVAIISLAIIIIGGIMYATAAGDERRTSRARKAIVGAIIGLIVGLLASTIVQYITSSIG